MASETPEELEEFAKIVGRMPLANLHTLLDLQTRRPSKAQREIIEARIAELRTD